MVTVIIRSERHALHEVYWRMTASGTYASKKLHRCKQVHVYLFVMLLLFCEPGKPESLWDRFREDICGDLGHHLSRMGRSNISQDDIYDYGLFLIDKTLKTSGSSLADFRSMSQPIYRDPHFTNNLIAEQLNYNRDQESALRCIESLNPAAHSL